MEQKIWLSSPNMGGAEIRYIQQAIDTNWVAPLGPNVNGFEQDLCDYTGTKACAALSSGTSAIHLALILLGIKRGDDIICSSFTFSATCNPILYQQANPVFIDSESETWNMNPLLLEKAIKDGIFRNKKPKAIIVVHLYGMPAKIDEIISIANKYEIPVIEDAAEALGSKYKGKALGTFGKFGILSFNGNKIITTSGGGALISDEVELIEKARFLATQARDNAPHYQHSEVGYNYRMSNIVAGIGRGQMEVLVKRVEQKRSINKWYKDVFKGIDGVAFLTELNNDYFSNYWLTTIIIDEKKAGFNREDLRFALEKENIEARPLWKPMHMQPVFEQYSAFVDKTSELLFDNGLCLPSDTNMTEIDKNRIFSVIQNILGISN